MRLSSCFLADTVNGRGIRQEVRGLLTWRGQPDGTRLAGALANIATIDSTSLINFWPDCPAATGLEHAWAEPENAL